MFPLRSVAIQSRYNLMRLPVQADSPSPTGQNCRSGTASSPSGGPAPPRGGSPSRGERSRAFVRLPAGSACLLFQGGGGRRKRSWTSVLTDSKQYRISLSPLWSSTDAILIRPFGELFSKVSTSLMAMKVSCSTFFFRSTQLIYS